MEHVGFVSLHEYSVIKKTYVMSSKNENKSSDAAPTERSPNRTQP
jgi:hypothetical protein